MRKIKFWLETRKHFRKKKMQRNILKMQKKKKMEQIEGFQKAF